jgi:hypothetical protein
MRFITLLITVVVLAVAAPAIAGKGGNPGGNGAGGGNDATPTPTATPSPDASSSGKKGNTSDPSITIAAVDGARTVSNPTPAHGSTVTFDTTSGSLAGWEHPMVSLSCYQNSELVYVVLDYPNATFAVGGGSSQWTAGDATCNASLYAYGWKGGRESIRELARTYDWTAVW